MKTPDLLWLACGETEPPDSDGWLSARDRDRLATMLYTKRYREARLSRWTAQRAVALTVGLGDHADAIGRVQISNAADGSPRAAAPGASELSVSSTDRAGWAVTVVRAGTEPIGCDLELVEPRSRAFVTDYFTEEEIATMDSGLAPFDVMANLIWSAKESALKVLRTGLRRDTRTVVVRPEAPAADSGWAALRVDRPDGPPFLGWWRRFGMFLLTVASETELPEPRSLIQPPPLASAEPVHSWLDSPRRANEQVR